MKPVYYLDRLTRSHCHLRMPPPHRKKLEYQRKKSRVTIILTECSSDTSSLNVLEASDDMGLGPTAVGRSKL